MKGCYNVSLASFTASIIGFSKSLSMAATLAIAAPWLMSLPVVLLFYYAFGGEKSKEKMEVLKSFVTNC